MHGSSNKHANDGSKFGDCSDLHNARLNALHKFTFPGFRRMVLLELPLETQFEAARTTVPHLPVNTWPAPPPWRKIVTDS